MSGPAIKAPRSDLFNVRPDSDTVVIRMITDPNHPEFDERALDPIDENLIADILARGQHTPATGYKSGNDEDGRDIVTLMFGRQRWKAVSEIWNRFRADGLDMSLAPSFRIYIQVPKNDAVKRELRISENRHRKPLEGLALAREVREYLNIVGESEESLEHARVLFNFVSSAALRNCLALLETTPAVQEQLTAGTLSPTGALQLSRQAPEVQDAVAERIAQGTESDEGADDDDCPESAEASSSDTEEQYAERPAKTKPVPVSEVREMIREATGKKAFEMATLKLVEKRLDKIASDLDKALTKLEDCHDENKNLDLAARVAKLQGWDEALRWVRGETSSSGVGAESQGNDPMSAAWLSMIDALVHASWPSILTSRELARFSWDAKRANEPGYSEQYRNDTDEARKRIDDSFVLFVSGEHVARRRIDSRGVTTHIEINVDTKWFTRLMDPYGSSANKIIREWGAHGWIQPHGKSAGISSYKHRWSQHRRDWVAITIEPKKLSEAVRGTPLGTPYSVEHQVLQVIRDNVETASITLDSRFGSPWSDDDNEGGSVGPDLNDDDYVRESILDEVTSTFELSWPRPEERTWATVGDLIDYVEKRLAVTDAAMNCEDDLPPTEAGTDGSTEERGKGGEE